ncbi:MAG: TIGR00725 family protein [bacterium]
MQKKRLQIGVMGSAADLEKDQSLYEIAEEVGSLIAKQGHILIFGAEKDYDSLSTAACRGAKKEGGLSVGVTYGKGLKTYEDADVIIATGLERGGGREFSLVLSCDAVIAISGGSGTLNEIVVAYQAKIPVVAIAGTGGWADKLAGQFIDGREYARVESAESAQEAVTKATELANAIN